MVHPGGRRPIKNFPVAVLNGKTVSDAREVARRFPLATLKADFAKFPYVAKSQKLKVVSGKSLTLLKAKSTNTLHFANYPPQGW